MRAKNTAEVERSTRLITTEESPTKQAPESESSWSGEAATVGYVKRLAGVETKAHAKGKEHSNDFFPKEKRNNCQNTLLKNGPVVNPGGSISEESTNT